MNNTSLTVKSIIVPRADAGQNLQTFLSKRFSVSMREAKSFLDDHRVWVNRRIIWMARHLLKTGDTVEIQTAGMKVKGVNKETVKEIEPLKIRILAETDDYLVVDKPAKLITVGKDSVETRMRAQTGNQALRAVHRLDRDTTGCLLMAKTEAARVAAVDIFKTHKVTKIYQAIVSGCYERTASTVQLELDGERAISHISRLASNKVASFIKVRIETGRTHQIRRHLSMIHYPVLGDVEYGLKKARDPRMLSLPRLMLHSCTLELLNPLHPKEEIKAHSPLPADFRRCLRLFDMGK